jgi:hypothetical protein
VTAEMEKPMSAVRSSADGQCVTCRVEGPCRYQTEKVQVLTRYGRLPHRQPGATQPERVGLRQVGVSWFLTPPRQTAMP